MKFMFNELCKNEIARQPEDFVREFVDVLRYAVKQTNETVSIIPCDAFWVINDKFITNYICDKDAKTFLLTQIDKAQGKDLATIENFVTYNGKCGKGLTGALKFDLISLSMYTHEKWNSDFLQVCDVNGLFKNIRHVVKVCHLDVHLEYYKTQSYCTQMLTDINRLEIRWDEFFGHLEYGNDAFNWLKNSGVSQTQFSRIVSSLYTLNEYLGGNGINLSEIANCSNESKTTIQQYGDERIFRFNDKHRTCLWHIKFNSGIRIHFDVDWDNRKGYVGYIGQHLKTKRYH